MSRRDTRKPVGCRGSRSAAKQPRLLAFPNIPNHGENVFRCHLAFHAFDVKGRISILRRAEGFGLPEALVEVLGVGIAHAEADLLDRHVRFGEQLFGVFHAQRLQIAGDRHAESFSEGCHRTKGF